LTNFRRAGKRLFAHGLSFETDHGVTDEGDPWFVFCEPDSGEIIAHFARIAGKYVMCVPFRNGALTGWALHDLVSQFVRNHTPARSTSIDMRSSPAA